MIKVKKKDCKQHIFPNSSGFFTFLGKSEILYAAKTYDLSKTICGLLSPVEDAGELFRLASLTTEISYFETADLFSAFLQQKIFLQNHSPEFNKILSSQDSFVYLAIDFYRVPYLHVTDATSENYFYIGPFQKRFFLYDLIDSLAAAFQYPACEQGLANSSYDQFPCSRMQEKKCYGWCIKEQQEISEILMRSYLNPNENLLHTLREKLESQLDELAFQQAETTKHHLQMIEKYYEYLKFFYVTKQLNLQWREKQCSLKIENGMLNEISEFGRYHDFPQFQPEYRLNEYLAHDKSQLAERWLIYQHILKNKLVQIDPLLKKSQQNFDEILK